MKQIIDNETGEIITIEDECEIAIRELNEVGCDIEQLFEMQLQLEALKDNIKAFEFKNRETISEYMKEHGLKSIRTDDGTITLKAGGLRKSIDSERLKEDGLYEKYLKVTPFAESLQVRLKGRKDD